MRVRTRPFLLLAAVMISWHAVPFDASAQDGRAQDSRDNPFLPTTTDEEDRRIAERERMRQVFREMMPEVKSIVQVEINSLRQQVTEDAKKSATEAVKADPTILAVQAGTVQANAAAVQQRQAPAAPIVPVARDGHRSKLPDGAKFVACVNQKAMYRDSKDGISFFYDPPAGSPSVCSG